MTSSHFGEVKRSTQKDSDRMLRRRIVKVRNDSARGFFAVIKSRIHNQIRSREAQVILVVAYEVHVR